MLRTLLSAFMLSFVFAETNSTSNGVTVSLDTAIIQQAEKAYWAALQKRINAISIPDLVLPSDDQMYLKANNLTITQPVEHFKFSNDVENNCLQIELNELTVKFTSDSFHAHYGVFGAHGNAEVKIDTTKLIFGFRVITQTLEDGKEVPAVEACNYDFSDFDKHDLSFDLHGSFWDGLIDAFKFAFEGKIVDLIKSTVEKELTEALPADLNKMIAQTDGFVQIPHFSKWLLDFGTEEPGHVTDASIQLGMRGILFDSDFNETVPTFPAMPYKDSSLSSELQAFVSEQSVNSLLTSLLQVTDLAGWFNATEVPADAKFQLTTGALDKAFKGMKDYYGPDCPVNVQFALIKLYDFAVTKDTPDLTAYADLNLKFWVETVNGTELAVDLAVDKFEFQGQVVIVDGFNVSANVTKLQVHNVQVNSCAFGHLGTFKLQMELNVGLAVAAPVIQKKISALRIPSSLFGHFELSDLVVSYYDGYLGVGATPIFSPPTPPPEPEEVNSASKVCIKNDAGFVMKWHFKDAHTEETSHDTEHYPVGKTKCMDIKDALPHV